MISIKNIFIYLLNTSNSMNYKNHVIEKFKNYKREDIIITDHAEEQAIFRNISLSEIKENIINPKRLVFAGKLETKKQRKVRLLLCIQ